MPTSYLGLGTESEYVNAQMRLRYSLELCDSHSSSTSSGTRLDGAQSETSNGCNSDSSKSINLSCMRSFGLAFDGQLDYDESELEFQVILVVFKDLFFCLFSC